MDDDGRRQPVDGNIGNRDSGFQLPDEALPHALAAAEAALAAYALDDAIAWWEWPLKKLKRILEAGLQASSAMNQQAWEFIVVTDLDLIKKLATYKYDHNMQGLIASKVPGGEAEQMAGAQRDAFTNSVAVALICSKDKRLPIESSWCCITTIWLAACAEGLGMSPAYFALPAQGPLKEMLGVPDGYDIAAILRLGVPDLIPEAKPRKSLDECLHYNRF